MKQILSLPLLLLLASCNKFQPSSPKDEQVLDGPISGLSGEQHAQFIRGDVAFNDEIFTKEKGLGPLFVSTSCGSCHAGDGKGHPFTTLSRFGQSDASGNQYLHAGGPQLQNRALQGIEPEQLPEGAAYARFTPPANTGLGYLEAVTDSAILAMSDPLDLDGDGISGVPNWILPKKYAKLHSGRLMRNGLVMGRFGKKAAAYDLLHQTAVAYNEDIGIRSVYEPQDTYSGEVGEPEITAATVLDVVFYLRTLKVPVQRDALSPQIIDGRNIFMDIGCGGCHRPELKTGWSLISPLSYVTFSPYTDLLLHDMGPELNDGYTEGLAEPAEWRTPPLWGLGLSKRSQGGKYYLLHDGRAQSIDQAIRWHGGEARRSRSGYQILSKAEQVKIIKFLESL